MPTTTFYPVADTYVRSDNPTANFDGNTSMSMGAPAGGKAPNPDMWACWRYNLASLAGKIAQSGTLYIDVTQWAGGATAYIYRASGKHLWTENGAITYNNRPTAATLLGTLAVTTAGQKGPLGITAAQVQYMIDTDNSGLTATIDVATSAALLTKEGSGAANPLSILYTTPPTTPGAFTEPDLGVAYNNSINVAWGASTDADGDSIAYRLEYWNGSAWVLIDNAVVGTSYVWNTSALPASTAYKLRVRAGDNTGSGPGFSAYRESDVFAISHNVAPGAPTPTNPVGGATIDRDQSNVFSWTFVDADAGDSQSAYELEDRPAAGLATSTGWVTSTSPSRTVAAGTIAAGSREWRVRTKDAIGEASPWSSWAQYVAATAPAAPAITAPVNGSTIAENLAVLDWSAPAQDAVQIRKVADAAGVPDTGTVYSDTGTIASTTKRDHALAFPTNTRWEHLQVRIRVAGLWSSWASVRVHVDYTPPPTPTVLPIGLDASGAIDVAITNPAPTGTQPAIAGNDLHRREVGDTGDGIRIAAAISSGGSFVDYKVASGVAYEYRAEALGTNGTSSFSAWAD
jgi:hypothetical protein